MNQALIHEYYARFNERRFKDAPSLFADGATVQYQPSTPTPRAAQAYIEFAERWLHAFPDARFTIEQIERQTDATCDVDLIATGTHLNALDLAPFGRFQPSEATTRVRMRETLEIQDGMITYAKLVYDADDLIHQVANIDYASLESYLEAIQHLRSDLQRVRSDRELRRDVTVRLGRALDAARLTVRPWFRRS